MKPSLQFRLSQHLTLTPQLQQSIRLLQLSTVELNQEIERMLMENPALEREDHEEAAEAPAAQGATSSVATEAPAAPAEVDWSADLASNWRTGGDDEENDRNFATPDTQTLRDHLHSQLTLTNLSVRDRAFVGLLIDALDDDGYLTQSLEEIAALLPAEAEADPEELSIALRHLQNFEPAGVGARSPGECLTLQLRSHAPCPARELALEICDKHLELLAARDYARLKNLTGCTEDTLRAAQQLIRGLNPRPGASFAQIEARYVVPDVIVKKTRGSWRASLNPDAMPRLRINRLYA
ncbi:MAG TPA: RNA polymerase factor sigma-54, partial [Burkholderiales bacterium]|nr:RNA polymerase factor sigma-54 [Burkholderiales bacterium]